MNLKMIIKLAIIGVLLTACSQKVELVKNSGDSVPSLVNLVFKPLQMDQLMEGMPDSNWELVKEIPFGEVKQQKITLSIYKEPQRPDDPIASQHAFIRFHDRYLIINEIISPELSETPRGEHSTLFLLQHTCLIRINS
ncbi:hypothetical protein [Paenibacillus sp. N3.4]|uniref:hypothetical protein n=1 Tax=Paenibacillus sp. N3.4 TaxID=2603222 RepID=UPI0011CB6694|nr:hypothetical protein [Paenibacillus sp. N3.4]TXK76722.1 hypothetical protein FU659_24940 [Paenibacillus sp. N3.4]